MKYNEMKESLKKKAVALREIKIGHKEAQRVLWFNSFGTDGRHVSEYGYYDMEKYLTPEIKRRRKIAQEAYDKCCFSSSRATRDYRVRHIAYSLFRGKTPEEIENNYYDGKWNEMDADIKKWVNILKLDNPVEKSYSKA